MEPEPMEQARMEQEPNQIYKENQAVKLDYRRVYRPMSQTGTLANRLQRSIITVPPDSPHEHENLSQNNNIDSESEDDHYSDDEDNRSDDSSNGEKEYSIRYKGKRPPLPSIPPPEDCLNTGLKVKEIRNYDKISNHQNDSNFLIRLSA
jgi:hypothetical protein